MRGLSPDGRLSFPSPLKMRASGRECVAPFEQDGSSPLGMEFAHLDTMISNATDLKIGACCHYSIPHHR